MQWCRQQWLEWWSRCWDRCWNGVPDPDPAAQLPAKHDAPAPLVARGAPAERRAPAMAATRS